MQNQIVEKDTIKSIYNQKHLNSFESENIDDPAILQHNKNFAFWIPEEFKSSADILKFYICNSDYLNEHFDSIKPKNKKDANMCLFAYAHNNEHLDFNLLMKFNILKQDLSFKYYSNINFANGLYNPLQTYVWEHCRYTRMSNDDYEAFYLLMTMVDLDERDSNNKNSLSYIYDIPISICGVYDDAVKIYDEQSIENGDKNNDIKIQPCTTRCGI